jgi:uncharacterized protein (DUF849 family)
VAQGAPRRDAVIVQAAVTESHAQLVERLVRIAGEVGRLVATPDEARAILGLADPAAR